MELTTSRLPIWPSLRARWDNAWKEFSSSVSSFPRWRFQGSTPRREPRPTSAEVSNLDRLLLNPRQTSLRKVNQNSFQERSVVISCSRNSNISFCQSGESLQAARNNSAEFEVSCPHICVLLITSSQSHVCVLFTNVFEANNGHTNTTMKVFAKSSFGQFYLYATNRIWHSKQ